MRKPEEVTILAITYTTRKHSHHRVQLASRSFQSSSARLLKRFRSRRAFNGLLLATQRIKKETRGNYHCAWKSRNVVFCLFFFLENRERSCSEHCACRDVSLEVVPPIARSVRVPLLLSSIRRLLNSSGDFIVCHLRHISSFPSSRQEH